VKALLYRSSTVPTFSSYVAVVSVPVTVINRLLMHLYNAEDITHFVCLLIDLARRGCFRPAKGPKFVARNVISHSLLWYGVHFLQSEYTEVGEVTGHRPTLRTRSNRWHGGGDSNRLEHRPTHFGKGRLHNLSSKGRELAHCISL